MVSKASQGLLALRFGFGVRDHDVQVVDDVVHAWTVGGCLGPETFDQVEDGVAPLAAHAGGGGTQLPLTDVLVNGVFI